MPASNKKYLQRQVASKTSGFGYSQPGISTTLSECITMILLIAIQRIGCELTHI